MIFREFIEIVMASGYDIADPDGVPLGTELLDRLEDDNVLEDEVELIVRNPLPEGERAIVADVHVADQVYQLVGNPRSLEELHYLLGIPREEAIEP